MALKGNTGRVRGRVAVAGTGFWVIRLNTYCAIGSREYYILTIGHLYKFKVSGRRGAPPALGSGEYGYSSNEIYVYGWLK
jgi:hypothetical protein